VPQDLIEQALIHARITVGPLLPPPRGSRSAQYLRLIGSAGQKNLTVDFMRKFKIVLSAATVALGGLALAAKVPATAVPTTGKVLILDYSVRGGINSPEALAVTAAGLTPEVVTDAAWAAMTMADFATYRAIVIGDPNCSQSLVPGPPPVVPGPIRPVTDNRPPAAAAANAAVWGAAVTGNVAINGASPSAELNAGGGLLLTNSIAFATADASKTGAYVSLSCWYRSSVPGTAVPMLSGLGTFTVRTFPGGPIGPSCEVAPRHIAVAHPVLTGITDESLTCVNEVFDSFPASYTALAVSVDATSPYTSPDGTKGYPYILAKGTGLAATTIALSTPAVSRLDAGVSSATLNATVAKGGSPVAGVTVTFTTVSVEGSLPKTLSAVTSAAGVATVTYTSAELAEDIWVASFTPAGGSVQRSNNVVLVWNWPTPYPTATLTVKKTVTGADPGVAFPVTVTCGAGQEIDLGPASKTFDLKGGETASFEVVWLDPRVTHTCVPSEVIPDGLLPAGWACTASVLGDDVDGTLELQNACTRPATGTTMTVKKKLKGDDPGVAFPLTVTCAAGQKIDGGTNVKTFNLKGGQSATFLVAAATPMCAVSENLRAGLLPAGWKCVGKASKVGKAGDDRDDRDDRDDDHGDGKAMSSRTDDDSNKAADPRMLVMTNTCKKPKPRR
jgi:hypothetical protein